MDVTPDGGVSPELNGAVGTQSPYVGVAVGAVTTVRSNAGIEAVYPAATQHLDRFAGEHRAGPGRRSSTCRARHERDDGVGAIAGAPGSLCVDPDARHITTHERIVAQ